MKLIPNGKTRAHYAADPRWHGLRERLQELVADGIVTPADDLTCGDLAVLLLLSVDDATGQDIQDIVYGRSES